MALNMTQTRKVVYRELRGNTQIVGELTTAASMDPTIEVTNVDANDAGRSDIVTLLVYPRAPSSSAIEFLPTKAEYPTTAIGSPPTRTKPKPCQLTVAAYFAEFKKTRS